MNRSKPHSYADVTDGGRLSSPSALRNIPPILEAIAPFVPHGGVALELASGTGQHAAALARAFADTEWQPTEIDPERRISIDSWRAHYGLSNMRMAQALDATAPAWRVGPCALVVTVNLLHLLGVADVQAVIGGVARNLSAAGHWFLYGPFRSGGAFRSPSDRAFHGALTDYDPQIGYKDIETIEAWAADMGLSRVALIEMPANNLAMVMRKSPRPMTGLSNR